MSNSAESGLAKLSNKNLIFAIRQGSKEAHLYAVKKYEHDLISLFKPLETPERSIDALVEEVSVRFLEELPPKRMLSNIPYYSIY